MDIAIIGMSCRFPEADNILEFWSNLKNGVDSIVEIPDGRWENSKALAGAKGEEYKIYCPAGGFIDDINRFDAGYFNMNDTESLLLDPQQKMALQMTKNLFMNAGYSRSDYYGKNIAVYMAASESGPIQLHSLYARSMQLDEAGQAIIRDKFGNPVWDSQVMPTSLVNIIAGRISNKFNLRGASMVIDTACSSSLVALHEACHALERGECPAAICGGVYLLCTPASYYGFSAAGALSESGKLSAFDATADGFVPGEGIGMILLKRLEEAQNDGDYIHGVIKGSIINNDGHSVSIMTPNPKGQRSVIKKFYEDSDIKPNDIDYMEAHGTGTPIGDMSEFNSLTSAFEGFSIEKNSIPLGSVKANIGHTISASGIASIIKILGMMEQDYIFPQINYHTPHRVLKINESPFYIADKKVKVKGGLKYAAVNSFGFGGTNAHVILENGRTYNRKSRKKNAHGDEMCVAVGGHNSEALQKNKQKLKEYLLNTKGKYDFAALAAEVTDIATEYQYVQSGVVGNHESFLAFLEQDVVVKRETKPAALLFTGQGSQHIGIGKAAYDSIPAFRRIVDECAVKFRTYIDADIRELIYESNDMQRINRTEFAQPIIFTIDYAIGRLVLDAGITPRFLLGHSIGEWVAAALADVVTLDEAIEIVSQRGKIMSEVNDAGKMFAVFSSDREKIAEIADDFHLEISADNATHIVVAGENEYIVPFIKKLEDLKIMSRQLNTASAFHTSIFEKPSETFKEFLTKFDFKKPNIRIIGNLTGKPVERYTPEYWADHIKNAVEFKAGMQYMKEKGVEILVECGSGNTLINMARGIGEFLPVSFLNPKEPLKLESFSNGLENLINYVRKMSTQPFYSGLIQKRIPLPDYCFADESHSMFKNYEKNNQEWIHSWNWDAVPKEELQHLEDPILIDDEVLTLEPEDLSKFIEENLTASSAPRNILIKLNAELIDDLDYKKHIKKYFWFIRFCLQKIRDLKAYVPHLVYMVRYGKETDLYSKAFLESMGVYLLSLSKQVSRINTASVLLSDRESEVTDIHFSQDQWVKYGNEKYYCRRMVPQSITPQKKDNDKEGCVIITGGAGRIGTILAEALLADNQKELVLIGRKPYEEVAAKVIFHHDNSKRIHYYSCDINDSKKVDEMITDLAGTYGGIDTVYHLAGDIRQDVICTVDSNFSNTEEVLQTKILGTMNLCKALGMVPVTKLILLSSVSASETKWSYGLADYAAANAFLDYITEETAIPAIALNYTLWDIEDGIDRKMSEADKNAALSRSGLVPIEQKRAVEVLMKLCESGESNAVYHIYKVCKIEPKRAIEIPQKQEAIKKDSQVSTNRVCYSVDEVKEKLYELIKKYTAADITEDNEGESFNALGLESISGISLINDINTLFGITLYPTIVYEHQSPIEMCDYLQKLFQDSKEEREADLVSEPSALEGSGDIAIVAAEIKISGAADKDAFWNTMINYGSNVGPIPSEHFISCDKSAEYSGGYMEDIYSFDPIFFGISPAEARYIDPQQRKLLELTYQALQKAGYINRDARKDVGVYVGVEQNNYGEQFLNSRLLQRIKRILNDDVQLEEISDAIAARGISSDAVTGNSLNEIATRVNYTFGLEGPSVVINSACSSSLAALSAACGDLRKGNISAAVIGGVNTNLSDISFTSMEQMKAISPKGSCKPFDAQADGMMLGEAVVSVVIKRLEDAVRDNNHIYGVIKDCAINNNGRSQGVTVPTVKGQQQVMEQIIRHFPVDAGKVQYIEAHGTGTPLGDPIEMQSIVEAYDRVLDDVCIIGSCKGNFGHPLAASGLVSVVKITQMFEHGVIPPIAGFESISGNIRPSEKFILADKKMNLRESEEGVYAGVNAFGFGGTNGHVLLKKYRNEHENKLEFPQPVLLSYYNPKGLMEYAKHLRHTMAKENAAGILKMVNCDSKVFMYKAGFVANSFEDLQDKLNCVAQGVEKDDICYGKSKRHKEKAVVQIEEITPEGQSQVLDEVIALFVKGMDVNLHNLYENIHVCDDNPVWYQQKTYRFDSPEEPAAIHGAVTGTQSEKIEAFDFVSVIKDEDAVKIADGINRNIQMIK